jgi:hypothetical protein
VKAIQNLLCRELIAVYCEKHTKYVLIHCVGKVNALNVEPGCTCVWHVTFEHSMVIRLFN